MVRILFNSKIGREKVQFTLVSRATLQVVSNVNRFLTEMTLS